MRVPIRKPGKYTHFKPDPRLTAAKLEELKKKLKQLKESDQPRAMSEVARLVGEGDFSENAGYQTAKGRLRGINKHILELEDHVSHARIIAPVSGKDCVQLGNRVSIDIGGRTLSYMILGSSETDPLKGIISDQSPIGSTLMGKKIGDSVTIKLDGKDCACRIVNIE